MRSFCSSAGDFLRLSRCSCAASFASWRRFHQNFAHGTSASVVLPTTRRVRKMIISCDDSSSMQSASPAELSAHSCFSPNSSR